MGTPSYQHICRLGKATDSPTQNTASFGVTSPGVVNGGIAAQRGHSVDAKSPTDKPSIISNTHATVLITPR
jgi:hypothetical protein